MSFLEFKDTPASQRGQQIEANGFKRVLSLIDPNPREATLEDQYNHIDWHSIIGTIDVKAMKRVSRDGKLQTKYIWVEFKNVAGYDGWLYGKQDWIAFEQRNGFLFVRRSSLARLAELKCDLSSIVDNARDALYKSYTRSGAKDIISMMRSSDLEILPRFFIEDVEAKTDDTSLFL